MTQPKKLVVLTTVLLIFNILLGIFAVFSQNLSTKQNNLEHSEVLGAKSIPVFNPNQIMSDQTFSSTRAFPSEDSIQKYLEKMGSILKDYTDQGKKSSYWIYAASRGLTSSKNTITPKLNPAILIAYLEKEQSLISLKKYDTVKDPQNRLKTAMGYGCPDNSKCDTKYWGLANQLNWAAYQLQYNYNLATGSKDNYRINRTIATLDEYNVFLENAATAANYRYTPHVYWGNYNLWKILTANGWTTSSDTYTYSQLDAVNLKNKDAIIKVDTGKKISFNEALPVLKKSFQFGQNNEDIKLLQRYLRQQNYYNTREITGMYGTITGSAHKKYNTDNNITANTKVDDTPQTPTPPNDSCTDLMNRTWKLGQTGEDVKKLQQCLRSKKFYIYSITGYFGTNTQTALKKAKAPTTTKKPDSQFCTNLKKTKWKFGQQGKQVSDLQQCLKTAGLYNWPRGITGYFGSYTQQQLAVWRSR